MRPTKRRIAAFVSIALAVLIAFTGSLNGPASAADQRIFVDLQVNGVSHGQVEAIMRGDDVLVAVGDLKEASVVNFAGTRETIGGTDFVSLRSLGPAFTFKLDEISIAVKLTVPPEFLAASVVDAGGRTSTVTVTRAKRSGYLNYSLDSGGRNPPSAAGELGATIGSGLFTVDGTVGGTASVQRTLTRWRRDDLRTFSRLVLGDTTADTLDWSNLGSTVDIYGVSLVRDFSLDSSGIHQQLGKISGKVDTPTTAEIYVNGALVRREELPPGPFTFVNLPYQDGTNSVHLVLRDAFGRVRVYDEGAYAARDLLPRGQHDFGFAFGRPVSENGGPRPSGLDLLGRYRVGIRDNFTLGGRLEATSTVKNVGATFSLTTRAGEFQGAFSESAGRGAFASGGSASLNTPADIAALLGSGGLHGGAEALQWNYATRRLSVGYQMVRRSRYYATAASGALDDRATFESNFHVGIPITRFASLGVSLSNSVNRDTPIQSQFLVEDRMVLGRFGTLNLSVGRKNNGTAIIPVFGIDFAMNLGSQRFSVRESNDSGSRLRTISIERPMQTAGNSIGYSVQSTSSGGSNQYAGQVDFRTNYLIGAALADYDGHRAQPSLRVAGGIAMVDNTFALTRPIQSGFALLDVDGLANVHTTVNGREVGVTNRRGKLFVSELSEYRKNEFSVASADAPDNVLIVSDKQSGAPMHRGGMRMHFATRRITAYSGSVEVTSSTGPIVPDGGAMKLTRNGQTFKGDLGSGGQFYLEGLDPGTYEVEVFYAPSKSCRFTLDLKQANAAVTPLGKLNCIPTTKP